MRALAFAAGVIASTAALYNSGASAEPLLPIEPQKAGFSAERLNRIEKFFTREIAQNRVSGAVVGIARDDNLVYLKTFGYRDKEKDLPMQVDSVFGLASMTKPMVAVAVGVLALTEQGKLPLFSGLATYLPEFDAMKVAIKAADGSTAYEPQQRPITIQDLLRHTSGLTFDKTMDGADNVPAGLSGHRRGHRLRSLLGTFGQVRISVPRARLMSADGKTCEWKSRTLPALPVWHQHAPGAPCTRGAVWRCGRQGRGEPGVAESHHLLSSLT